MPVPVILDCDPGVDDAAGILLACARPELDVRAITTVGGNTSVVHTTRNALDLLAFAGIEGIPVAQGADRALLRPFHLGTHIHGATGFGGVTLPDSGRAPLPIPAVDLIARVVRESATPVTLIPTGPLPNIALFLLLYPELKPRIARICLMGGGVYEGNATPAAEANFRNDPEAARIVFASGLPITMVGLNVTHRALFTTEHTARLRGMGKVAVAFAEMLDFRMRVYGENYGFAGAPLHDPIAVAEVLRPGIVTTQSCAVTIETDGPFTAGRSVVDLTGVTEQPPNAAVAMDIDVPGFVTMLLEAIGTYKD
ncbi:MAG: nucleoside hydrolase [Thermomicrobia bacterium]|nr:nucleoside hydrolase [Thermomicrobia bacterium]